MDRSVFDASFKWMAIGLSYARGSVNEVADELGIDPSQLGKWRRKDSSPVRFTEGLTDEQKEIKRLQKELKGFNRRGLYRMKQIYNNYSTSSLALSPGPQAPTAREQEFPIVSSPMTQFGSSSLSGSVLAK